MNRRNVVLFLLLAVTTGQLAQALQDDAYATQDDYVGRLGRLVVPPMDAEPGAPHA